MNPDILRRLAGACAHGTRQQGLVNELLGNRPVLKGIRKVGQDRFVRYGRSDVQASSFRNLRRRLHAVGFLVVTNRETGQVTMTFPEQE